MSGPGAEEFNEEQAVTQYKMGMKETYNVECNEPPTLRFVEGLGPNYLKIHGGPVVSVGTLDSWVTRYPNAKLK